MVVSAFLYLIALLFALLPIHASILKVEGKGFLEEMDGQRVLHVEGSAFERGYQHGKLLKNDVEQNIATYLENNQSEFIEVFNRFKPHISKLLSFVPEKIQEEMKGLAQGAGVPLEKIIQLNLFPEMFHCSGVTVTNEATKDKSLYHVRVLEYAAGKNLQQTAVLMVVNPDEGYAFMSVNYAGFIGVVTGMNNQKIALGEIGGKGYGFWNGMPMSFLMREVLEKASSLEEARQIFTQTPRTCEYYYVVSDGKNNESLGIYATASQIQFIEPGSSYALISAYELPKNYLSHGEDDKFCLPECFFKQSSHQALLYDKRNHLTFQYHNQPQNCLVLTGFSYPERYPILIDRILASYGKIDAKLLQEVVKAPASRSSSLHTAIFHPSRLQAWIAHASLEGDPSYTQNYVSFNLQSLLDATPIKTIKK